MAQEKLIFISGGVRSGKSSFAEKLANEQAKKWEGKLHYVACGLHTDQEMAHRIQRHQELRSGNVIPWRTWEQPVHLLGIANQFTKDDIVLIDCVTTLLGNELFSLGESGITSHENIIEAIFQGICQIKTNSLRTIVVSNEVFHEPVHLEPFTFTYTKLLGQLHQKLVAAADYAYMVEVGIPVVMKGEGVKWGTVLREL